MALRVVRLGGARHPREGVRIGTVRRPPRGVRKGDYARLDYYDVWLPALSPSPDLLNDARADGDDEKGWRAFVRKFEAEMRAPDASRLLDLLAVLSRGADFSVGCYCAAEDRCHRSVLRRLLRDRRALIAD